MAHWREDVLQKNPLLTIRSDIVWLATNIKPLEYHDGELVRRHACCHRDFC